MRQEYLDSMNKGIDRNFQLLAESLDDARELVDDGRILSASRELREMIDGIIQTLEIMSTKDLVENRILMEAINHEK